MECIVAYLLLALFVDLALDLMAMEEGEEEAVWIKRRLWTDTPYDCGTRAVSILAPLTHQTASQNRNRFRRKGEPIVTKGTSRNLLSRITPDCLYRSLFPENLLRKAEG